MPASGIAGNFIRLTPFFLGGSLTFFLLQRVQLNPFAAIACLAAVLVVVQFSPVRGWNGTALLAPLITYFVLWATNAFPLGAFGTLTRKHDISYGMYIYGWPVQQLLMLIMLQQLHPWTIGIYLAAVLALTTGFAVCSWKLVEHPVLLRLRKNQ
jgi:peptidoglycan/LPS O-acetylase OafA/YrhL